MPASSIQSFFSSSPTKNSDGFTAEEVQSALQPSGPSQSTTWIPTLDYEEISLGDLQPGPGNRTLTGRVVNFYEMAKPSKRHKAAQGYIKIMLADDTGVLTVRLWYANTVYKVRLGQLVSLWTVHVSNSAEHNSLAPNTAPLFTSIFPEGERHCWFMTHENSDDGTQFRRPFGCGDSKTLPGLMTLRSFADGGYDVDDPKLMVCVKSIGAKKRYINRNSTTSELISLGIFDDTADAQLTLYAPLCDSASTFQPSKTVLLISNPGWRIDKTAKLTLNGNSRVDIDPELGDARRLRALAQRLTKKEHVNPPFPDVDVSDYETAPVRALFRLAEVDDFARANPRERLVGYISVIITELNIVVPFKRNMLLSNECCGIPVFANTLKVQCKQCDKEIDLRVNPRILGPVIDETGQIASGKLILSDQAWTQLLGRTPEQLVATSVDVLRYLEQRLLLLRVTMGFAVKLEDEVGRLGVWCVKN
ncbi:hypothetical protein P153DRAFT_407812 [Dothidotthia symphoricarpi CBS 119687]|uniref:Nucleic acid-binding protein n=1 Tax=Dothidotthia symphoricarpi CBS 119687 TaxID=1392245 RepID=A0A6A6A403_9PLEO|nr:uncharacterized protein P153DRAFT_407812 [Dothidotthia symphoricarpi CBS 119687]KAF2126619.1 hypothetical protein P153DRAFT_407812 [Dothidotthia symphoricarpi CBS 119687]